jgi:hypothetical protein
VETHLEIIKLNLSWYIIQKTLNQSSVIPRGFCLLYGYGLQQDYLYLICHTELLDELMAYCERMNIPSKILLLLENIPGLSSTPMHY